MNSKLCGMWDARPEQLKAYWTGRTVQVRAGGVRLERFAGRTGRVRTVNMNGRPLVQFAGPDETWYDLDPAVLVEVEEAPDVPSPVRPAVGEEPTTKPTPAKAVPSEPKQTPGGKSKLSVLDLARRQGAAKG